MDVLPILYAVIGGYLLGAVPFGLVLARLAGHGDIRAIGSGNIGATNVLRTGNKGLALITLLLDAGKAGIAALIAGHFFGFIPSLVAGGAALLGHCFPVWLGFRGGKGVATFFGTLAVLAWKIALIAAAIWLICAALTRYSSLSALLAAAATPLVAYFLSGPPLAGLAAFMAMIIFFRHRENISRLLSGSETKIGGK